MKKWLAVLDTNSGRPVQILRAEAEKVDFTQK